MSLNDGLRTGIHRLSYDFHLATLDLFLPPNACTDLQGAIDMATAIDPDARRIDVWSGDVLDCHYLRYGDTWKIRESGWRS